MQSLKKLLSLAENKQRITTTLAPPPVATVWELFVNQIKDEIYKMSQDQEISQDQDEDQALKRLLRWTENNKALANSDRSITPHTLVAWEEAVSAIRQELYPFY